MEEILIVIVIFLAIVCVVDSSVFFLDENTEELFYVDETIPKEEQQESMSQTTVESKNKHTAKTVKESQQGIPEDDFAVDTSKLAEELINDVQRACQGGDMNG